MEQPRLYVQRLKRSHVAGTGFTLTLQTVSLRTKPLLLSAR